MAAIAGLNGYLQFGGSTVVYLDSVTLNRNLASHEITQLGGDGSAEFVMGVRSWDAAFTGTLDLTDAAQLAVRDQLEDGVIAAANCKVYLDGTANFEGSCFVESDSIGLPVGDKASWSGTLRGTGALAYSAS